LPSNERKREKLNGFLALDSDKTTVDFQPQAKTWNAVYVIALAQGTAVNFLHTPADSPSFNPAEYLIRLVRKNSLDHLPCAMTIQEQAECVRSHLAQAPPQTPQ
jgi:hypothetical protein